MPQLTKNLISLGALESKGLVVMMRDGILKTTSGALVMLKGMRNNNLYYYQGSTVVGTVATATSSNNKDAEVTKLWHLRLGHAGERSLQILAKQGLLKVEKVCCMLSNAELDRKFWTEAITYDQHIVNRLPCSAIDGKAPLEVNPNSSDTSQQVEYTPKQVEFEEVVQSEPIPVRRTRRENKRPARFADMVAYALPVVDDQLLDKSSLTKLDSQVREVAYRAEDIIESRMVHQMISGYDSAIFTFITQDLQQVILDLDSLMEQAKKLVEMEDDKMLRQLDSSMEQLKVAEMEDKKMLMGIDEYLMQLKDRLTLPFKNTKRNIKIVEFANLDLLLHLEETCDEEWELAEEDVFCSLQFLHLEGLLLVHWIADETNFPRLRRLRLDHCSNRITKML
ncbi:hypothetical protein SASPL_152400 [Salvia splendens]|uniref:GAG-pre-integrase domain-containing protein n=1 Tax=Salvia splendens TaxID=180675 RepID=A0A8X8W3I7_SALSN|nr:hypothetical protein SASPL_152400 [Salvia splendens]